jgi:DNA polymerase I-like protein with 3'-5' exonuclease and polymerase domains
MQFNDKGYEIKLWTNERIGSLIAFDTETPLVDDWTKTPNVVIGQAYAGNETVYIISPTDFKSFFDIHRGSSFIFHNAPFDVDVCVKQANIDFHKLYDSNRIFDTSVLYRLWYLATKGYVPKKHNLKLLTKELLDIDIDKGDERVTFGQYENQSIESISKEHLEYAAIDVIITWECYFNLRKKIAPLDSFNTLLSHHIQVKGDLALNRIYKRGIGFDTKRKTQWLKAADSRLTKIQNRLATWGWVRGMKGVNERYESIINFIGIGKLLPRTKDGKISSASEDLLPYSDYPFIGDYLAYIELEKKTTFVRDLEGERIHPQYNLLMNTGRTSARSPNIQQLPRDGLIRSMYVSKSNNSLIMTDYAAIELSTLSQVTLNRFGKSVMGDKINEGIDLHRYYASVLNNIPEKDITKAQRQEAKASNFGFPGGLGLDTFIQFSKGYGLNLNREQAQKMKNAWFTAFPEMRSYLNQTKEGDVYTLTGRCRANAFYCAAANTPFQGLASDGFKIALYELDKQGFSVVAQIHDEVVIEELDCDINDATVEIERIMVAAMKTVVPEIAISVESQIGRRYKK